MDLLGKIDTYLGEGEINEEMFDYFLDGILLSEKEEKSKGQWVRTLIGLGVLKKEGDKLVKTGKKVSDDKVKSAMKDKKGKAEKNDKTADKGKEKYNKAKKDLIAKIDKSGNPKDIDRMRGELDDLRKKRQQDMKKKK